MTLHIYVGHFPWGKRNFRRRDFDLRNFFRCYLCLKCLIGITGANYKLESGNMCYLCLNYFHWNYKDANCSMRIGKYVLFVT